MGDLTEHFDLSEFASKDGAPFPDDVRANLKKTAEMLELLREAVSQELGRTAPLIVTSGYRSPGHNVRVGGVPNSYHVKGMAADVICRDASAYVVQRVALRLQHEGKIGGVGSYQGFTHVDLGPSRRWSESQRADVAGA